MDKKKKASGKKASESKKRPAAKAAETKASAKPSKQKEKSDIRRVAMEKRTTQEKDSIAPPTERLVDAFSLLKKNTSSQRQAPAVTRLPARATPVAPPPAGRPPMPKPAPVPTEIKPTAAASAAPAPAAPKPLVSVPQPAAPPKAAPAKPAQFPAVARPLSAPKPTKPAPPAPVPAAAAPQACAVQPLAPAPVAPRAPALKPLKVTTQITVRELAEKMEIKVNDLIKKLMSLGLFVTINQRLDSDAAVLAAGEFGFELEVAPMPAEEELALKPELADKPENLKPRSPVVTIMGHVDHGKTSLLDAIRSARVAEGEAGGITQHIGAYQVSIPKGQITFLDTPGHEAFTAMRARGAKVTDIVVLVVSAADGVMPQTLEAIDHAKAAGVPIVVAVNKIDLPTAQPQKIRQELSAHGLVSEEWGGKHIFVDVSAKKRLNIEKLLEMLLLQAEVLELKANPDRPGVGVILEARLDAKRGNVATLLVQNGAVRIGQPFVVGVSFGKVKALINDRGERIHSAGPATPVELLGISESTPQAGDVFSVVSDERQARDIAQKRRLISREEALAHKKHMSLVGLKSEVAKGAKELRVILKADVQGSVQAIRDSLEKLATPEIGIRILHAGVGNASESDVLLAGASDAVIFLFHADLDSRARETADRAGVETRRYDIIYDLLADVKAAMEGLLEPELIEVVLGKAEIRQVFTVRGATVAGCMVKEGKAARGASVRVIRGTQTLADAKVESLKRFKDDVAEVEKGFECGVSLAGFKDFAAGDILEFLTKEKRTRRLEQPA